MVILLLGKQIDRDVTSVEQRKNSEALVKNRTSDLRIPRSGALLLSHRDYGERGPLRSLNMTHVLHIARINNVDSTMFCKHESEILFFKWTQMLFLCPVLVTRRINIFLYQ